MDNATTHSLRLCLPLRLRINRSASKSLATMTCSTYVKVPRPITRPGSSATWVQLLKSPNILTHMLVFNFRIYPLIAVTLQAGQFWRVVETKSYMRILHQLLEPELELEAE